MHWLSLHFSSVSFLYPVFSVCLSANHLFCQPLSNPLSDHSLLILHSPQSAPFGLPSPFSVPECLPLSFTIFFLFDTQLALLFPSISSSLITISQFFHFLMAFQPPSLSSSFSTQHILIKVTISLSRILLLPGPHYTFLNFLASSFNLFPNLAFSPSVYAVIYFSVSPFLTVSQLLLCSFVLSVDPQPFKATWHLMLIFKVLSY